ncbi:F0F1 ATP synthase subunit A [Patescibacteria group bacterium]|nr:F0F1 ATP synthase subunit A [Patescibacteria group bacterium]MBU0963915.1 F0F1 ATP synthase subunit A [Patescibacteria group bacterium]
MSEEVIHEETTANNEHAEQETITAEAGEYAAEETHAEISHEPTLYAEPIFNIGSFQVTNSLINSWAVVLILVVLALVIRKSIKKIPRGMQNAFEIILEGAMNLADSVTGNRKKTVKIFPFVFAVFVFILLNNWLGLIPGIGSIGFIETHGGHDVFVPWFRGATADLNTTLALALFAVIGSNFFGILMVGVWRHFNKFINLGALVQIPMKIRKEPTLIFVNPIKFFVGIIEIIGEVAKVASLSFRLFGNIFAGEVLLSSMAVLFAFVLPIPFIFLEIIVGIIQALIFAMLMLVYFSIASTAEEH